MPATIEQPDEKADLTPVTASLKEASDEELLAMSADESLGNKLRIAAAGVYVQRKNAELYRRLA